VEKVELGSAQLKVSSIRLNHAAHELKATQHQRYPKLIPATRYALHATEPLAPQPPRGETAPAQGKEQRDAALGILPSNN